MIVKPFVVWHYTKQCNLNCAICYESAGRAMSNELSLDEKMDFVDQVRDVNPKMLAFTGGEAVTGKFFWEVLDYAAKKVPVCLSTNGYDISRHLDRLKETGLEVLNFSLYSTKVAVHDSLRGGNQTLERVLSSIREAKKKRFKIELSIPVTRSNIDEVDELISLGKSLKVNEIELLGYCKTGNACNVPEEDITPQERLDLLKKAYDSTDRKTRVWCFDPRYPEYRNSRDHKDDILFGCDAGLTIISVQPDGTVTPCPFVPDLKVGNVREERLIDIYKNSPILSALRDKTVEGHCGSCTIKGTCGGCRAKAYSATKNIFAADPTCLGEEFVKVIKNEQ